MISDEMKMFFNDRTANHIKSVVNNLKICSKNGLISKEQCARIGRAHDRTKFLYPEDHAIIAWKYKCEGDGIPFNLSKNDEERVREATYRHVCSEKHHPEFWDNNITINSINLTNRDRPGGEIVNASLMGEQFLIEMVCDWGAVASERGNKIIDWFRANDGKRWAFSQPQRELIIRTIGVLEGP